VTDTRLNLDLSLVPEALVRDATTSVERVASLAADICTVPAPSNDELERAAFVAAKLKGLGYQDVEIDEVGNVIVRRGTKGGKGILVMAHTDTVFPADTEILVRRNGNWLSGPGIGDNSTSVAAVLTAIELLDQHRVETPRDLIIVFNVGEEGLGNLRGARAATDRFGNDVTGVIVVDGKVGNVTHAGVGSSRWRVTVTGPGGHSFMHFGRPSAIHALGRIIARLAEMRVPIEPKTTFNVGVISGGTSVNTIAASAEAIIDLRSESAEELAKLEVQARSIIEHEGNSGYGITTSVEVLGERPAGALPRETPLVQLAADSVRRIGLEPQFQCSSTDANIPISRGIPAVCIGAYEGEEAHTLNERVYVPSLERGMVHVLDLLIRAGTIA
jgi:acetylornithine deacetylase/succinyl-diaminopimelate desuccinylase-like protein